ncbi:MAG TPA: tetratricopeptide repeat protein [Paludibacter sp.]|nr:tetratricopeptide repeat protein [Paludibacter sp.]
MKKSFNILKLSSKTIVKASTFLLVQILIPVLLSYFFQETFGLNLIITFSLLVAFFAFIFFWHDKRTSKNPDIVERSKLFVDREIILYDLLKDIKDKKITILHGDAGIGKTELMKKVYLELSHDDNKERKVIWVDVDENPSYDGFLRSIHEKLFNRQESKIENVKVNIIEEFCRKEHLVLLDFNLSQGQELAPILAFISELGKTKAHMLISTDNTSGLTELGVIKKLGPLEENDRKKLIEIRVKVLELPIEAISSDVDYLCQQQSNTLMLIRAVELYAIGFSREAAINKAGSEYFNIQFIKIVNEEIRLRILSVFFLLDFHPSAKEVELISGVDLEEVLLALKDFHNTSLFYFSEEEEEYKIDYGFKNFLIHETDFADNIFEDIYENWIGWALDSSKKCGGKDNWGSYYELFTYIKTYLNVLKYCGTKQRHQNIITLWENVDFFLSYQSNTDYYEQFGVAALNAALELNDRKNIAIIQSEVLGYINIFRKPYSDEMYDTATVYLDEAEAYFVDVDAKCNLANIYRYKSRLLYKKAREVDDHNERVGLLTEAKNLANKALESINSDTRIVEEEKQKNICFIINNLSIIERRLGNFDKAVSYQKERLEIANYHSFKDVIAESYFQLGRIYQSQGNYPVALENYLEVLKNTENDVSLHIHRHVSYFRMAEIYCAQGQSEKAKGAITKAIEINRNCGAVNKRYEALLDKVESGKCEKNGQQDLKK